MAQELQSSGLHIFVSLKQVSSTCPVSFLALPDTGHKAQVHPLLIPFRRSHLHKQALLFSTRIPCDVPRQSGGPTQIPSLTGYEPKTVEFEDIETETIEAEDLEPRRIELYRNLGTDPYQIQERFTRNSLTEDMDEFGKVGVEMSYLQSQMHSDYDSAESIADSDLEDGELRKNAGFNTVYAKLRRL